MITLTCHLRDARNCKPRKQQPCARKGIHLKAPERCTAPGTSRISTPIYSYMYKPYLGTKRPSDGADMRAFRGARCLDRSPLSLQQKKKNNCTLKILCNKAFSKKRKTRRRYLVILSMPLKFNGSLA